MEDKKMLIYGAETLEWAIERARQLSIEKWEGAIKEKLIPETHNFIITPECLQGLADSLRMRAEESIEILKAGGCIQFKWNEVIYMVTFDRLWEMVGEEISCCILPFSEAQKRFVELAEQELERIAPARDKYERHESLMEIY